jgi:ABC-2 type transport system permease protein
MNKLFTIAKNTFIETLRQPVYLIIIAAALFLFFMSPSLTMYTMSDDNKLLREIGLSTLFLTSLFIAIFAASGAVAEEIDNKTITTVLSKPVQRPIFIVAKFFGVAAAVAMAHYICTVALLMSVRHGVLVAAWETHDWTVLTAGGATVALTFILSAFFNYTYDWKFSSTAVVLAAFFATIGIIFLVFVDRNWKFNPAENGIYLSDVYGSLLLLMAAIIIVALAVAVSTRFNIVVTLSACVGIFLLGLVSDYVFGRFTQTRLPLFITVFDWILAPTTIVLVIAILLTGGKRIVLLCSVSTILLIGLAACLTHYAFGHSFGTFVDAQLWTWAKMCYFLLPNLQAFWISDAIYEESAVPLKYVMITGSYALCYTVAILAFAVAVFQRRQVG